MQQKEKQLYYVWLDGDGRVDYIELYNNNNLLVYSAAQYEALSLICLFFVGVLVGMAYIIIINKKKC